MCEEDDFSEPTARSLLLGFLNNVFNSTSFSTGWRRISLVSASLSLYSTYRISTTVIPVFVMSTLRAPSPPRPAIQIEYNASKMPSEFVQSDRFSVGQKGSPPAPAAPDHPACKLPRER